MRKSDIDTIQAHITAYLEREKISQNELARRAGQPLWWVAWFLRESKIRDASQILPGIERLDAIHSVITGKPLLTVATELCAPLSGPAKRMLSAIDGDDAGDAAPQAAKTDDPAPAAPTGPPDSADAEKRQKSALSGDDCTPGSALEAAFSD